MKAIILAAGFGTRLFPLTVDRTKPAIPFLGKPLVGYAAEYLAKFGFTEIVVNLHHQPESVMRALGDGSKFGVKIHYALEQPAILGTAGALWNAREFLQDDTFLTINGKIITDIDLRRALETHKKSNAVATMVLKENAKHEKFTIIETENDSVKGFGGFPAPIFGAVESLESRESRVESRKPESENRKSGESGESRVESRDQKFDSALTHDSRLPRLSTPLMYTGIQILEPAVFDYIPPAVESDIISVFYRPAIARGAKIAAHVASGNWYELSTINRYLDISLAVLNGENAGITTGANCRIDAAAIVRDSILWDNVTIESGARVSRSILGDNVVVKSGETVENKLIVRACLVRAASEIPEKAMPGFFENERYVVPLA